MKSKTIWIILAIIFVIIIIVVLRKLFGKKPGTSSTNTNNQGNAMATADRLYELMNGLTIYPSSRKEVVDTLTQVSNSSDADFTAVWIAFGNRDGNLSEWAADEYYVDSAISDAIKNRATQLGLN